MQYSWDTVGILALLNESDQWHDLAERAYTEIKVRRVPVLTTTFVLLECGNAAARRPFRRAVAQWRDIMAVNNGLVAPSQDDWNCAWAAYDGGEPGSAGIVDHVSFAVMRRLGVRQAFTNDQHFRAAGFETLF